MGWNDRVLSDSTRATQLVQKGSAALLALAGALLFAMRHRGGLAMAGAVTLVALLAPAFYALLQRFLAGVRQRETDKRIVMQTRACLLSWQANDLTVAGQKRMPSSRGFRQLEATPAGPRGSMPAICEAAPRPASVWRFSPRLPHPVTTPLAKLVSPAAAKNLHRGTPHMVIN